MIADVVFNLPLHRAFSYLVPPALAIERGQRVRAPLQGRIRIGVVVDLRDGDREGLQALRESVEPVPVLSPAMLRLARWAADESLSSLGSTIAALLPPPSGRAALEPIAPPPATRPARRPRQELWVDAARDDRLADFLAREKGSALLIAPDVLSAGRWAERLDAPRLDSGVPEAARRAAWFGASGGHPRIVVGTRSALLAPLPPPATLVLLQEHDAAHKPPGPPRLHSRDLLRERAHVDGSRLLLLSGAPSVESWWRAESGELERLEADPGAWPEVVTADTRGILRNHPFTLPLTRSIEETTRRGGRVALIIARQSAALGCDDCGALFRCPDCGIALALSRTTRSLGCRLCARTEPLPATCPSCGGHRLSAVGWGAERVEASIRKRFPGLRVASLGVAATRRARVDPGAQVVIGPAAMLRALPTRRLGCVGFVALDGLLRIPDFRAGERAFQSLWAAAEAVAPGGRVIVQTLHPEHYAIRAVRAQDRGEFYSHEMKFRGELGYPPFRRLCIVSVTGASEAGARTLIEECARRLRGIGGLDVYPGARRGSPAARRPRWALVIKGPDVLPELIREPLLPFLERRRRGGDMVEVEMDPAS